MIVVNWLERMKGKGEAGREGGRGKEEGGRGEEEKRKTTTYGKKIKNLIII